MKNTLIRQLIKECGGAKRVAEELGITDRAVNNWIYRQQIPAEYCPTLERLTSGKYRCEQMRPDVEWSVLRGASPISSSAGTSTP
ncbi:helix-turn-helix domain-containing protein [Pseudogulbenkiania sp. NH8B]|uniref:helix-turn-helix domain-containing protein n=1 Tax=Pseudogulbenkiania sp. (strain NH8B) TaxID=748280 RepID=UPI00059F8595|nr:helix-turn-helix domain-containing protein [Pseudogulbenkiania sp. NH8B]